MLYRLFAASSLLLLIACANVANLLVARLASRQSELAVRIALGAGRGRLVQQLLVESLLLAIGGAIGGVVLAVGGIKLLAALTPANLPRAENVGVDWRVLLFALATSAATALTLGLIGAWRGASGDLRAALSQSQRTQSGGAAAERLRGALVVTQLGVTVVLLIGASLLGRSFMKLMQVDPGFHTQHLVVATLPGPEGGSPAALARRVQLFDETVRRARALPGVRGVGSAATMPLSGDGPPDGGFLILQSATEKPDFASFPALSKDSSRTGAANYEPVGPGYFETMGIPVLSGRVFADDDRSGAPHVAVINATLARSRWPNENPVGKVLEYGNMDGDLTPITIVGVVGDVKENGLAAPAQATVYIDYRQRPGQAQQLVLIMATDRPNAVIPEARGVLREIAPGMPVNVTTVERIVSRSVADRRFMLVLVGVFGAAALLLATLGVYSVVAYLVTQRGREISIRVALGASSSNILRLVLRQGVVLAIAGCAVGVVGAAVATRLLRSSLYETTTTDRTSFIGVVVLLCIVAVIASYIPARRAARIEPMDVMRSG